MATLCLDATKSRPAVPSIQHHSPMEAGHQRQGKLWSNLKEVCDLLYIAAAVSVNSEEVLFQHVQFKSGQRIHMIEQAFDYLYAVNSGFLKTVLIDEFGNEQVLSFPMKGDMRDLREITNQHLRCHQGRCVSRTGQRWRALDCVGEERGAAVGTSMHRFEPPER